MINAPENAAGLQVIKERTAQLGDMVNRYALIDCAEDASVTASVASLRVGCGNVIHRWKRGSVVTAFVNSYTFPSSQHSRKAMDALRHAMNEWNVLNIGVSFALVGDIRSAVFQLAYEDDTACGDSKTYATSFLPGYSAERRRLVVFAKAFESQNVGFMANIFYHELGHILGLRHERAHELDGEKHIASVQFGCANSESVMSNDIIDDKRLYLIQIHRLDKLWMQRFYAYNEPSFAGLRIEDVEAQCLDVNRLPRGMFAWMRMDFTSMLQYFWG